MKGRCRIQKQLSPFVHKQVLQSHQGERKHYVIFKKYMGQELKPGWVKVNLLKLMDRIFGDTFTIKFFEPREDFGSKELRAIQKEIPEVRTILAEEEHEKPLNGLNR